MWNHAKAMVAADFLLAITAGFRMLYVLVVMEIGSRRIVHCNVTAHPTEAWTLQQFREAVPGDHNYRFLIHDRDSIFSTEVDGQLKGFGVKVLRFEQVRVSYLLAALEEYAKEIGFQVVVCKIR